MTMKITLSEFMGCEDWRKAELCAYINELGKEIKERDKPRLVCNCKYCHYYTRTRTRVNEGVCHRYPKPIDREDMNYCGEFAWKNNAKRWER